ncbi:GAF domain-containing protein [Aeromonas simiae]|uniref:GAF domain-containing protein n=1 Tax=Aeromonas simiae TaxID=218936 RepID=UPI00266D0D47|nr:GAF domain-containing protein [Aeromonas simiae]MDO2951464.1 GAF domain-containing protein [Aeromonas simiae]
MSDKNAFYLRLQQQVSALIEGELDAIANMANLSALLNLELEGINWVGFYILRGDTLVLGPFQGKPACIRIPVGRGVCGTAAAENATQLVADVHQFAGHIACDAASNSEVVIPVRHQGRVVAVLDIDSPLFSRFDANDAAGLEGIVAMLERGWSSIA